MVVWYENRFLFCTTQVYPMFDNLWQYLHWRKSKFIALFCKNFLISSNPNPQQVQAIQTLTTIWAWIIVMILYCRFQGSTFFVFLKFTLSHNSRHSVDPFMNQQQTSDTGTGRPYSIIRMDIPD